MTTRASAPTITEDTIRALSRRVKEPQWLLDRRLAAWRAYEAMAMPDASIEEWRRTDISGLDLEGVLGAVPNQITQPPQPVASVLLDRDGLDGLLVQQDDGIVEHFAGPEVAQGLVFMDLQSATTARPALVQPYLHSLVQATEWKLAGLQAAAWQGGTFVYVPRGVEVRLPLRYVAHLTGRSLFPHLLIVAEENSDVTVVQEGVSADEAAQSLVSGAVEIIAGPNARVRFCDVQSWGNKTYNFSTIRARLDRGAQLTAALVGLGGRLTKTRVEALRAHPPSSSASASAPPTSTSTT
jgi:Fe-S cluster assembly protein SufD